MNNKTDYFEDIRTIKKIMEDSSRFLSLSGLSGVFAGLFALAGAVVAYVLILKGELNLDAKFFEKLGQSELYDLKLKMILDAAVVLILALGVCILFSYRKSVRQGVRIWTPISKRLLVNFIVPILTGGVFILILCFENQWQLLVPSMLIFYGLALVNAGKFTYNEVFYLGILEILIGLTSSLFPALGIWFWCVGFGLLHIFYGLILYRKYKG
jgi:hypothetical protein